MPTPETRPERDAREAVLDAIIRYRDVVTDQHAGALANLYDALACYRATVAAEARAALMRDMDVPTLHKVL